MWTVSGRAAALPDVGTAEAAAVLDAGAHARTQVVIPELVDVYADFGDRPIAGRESPYERAGDGVAGCRCRVAAARCAARHRGRRRSNRSPDRWRRSRDDRAVRSAARQLPDRQEPARPAPGRCGRHELDDFRARVSRRPRPDARTTRPVPRPCRVPASGRCSTTRSSNTVFWVFPNDRKIAGLAAVADGELSRRDGLPRVWQSTRLMAYAPEKSATLACLDARRRHRRLREGVGPRSGRARLPPISSALTNRSSAILYLRLPRPLAYLPQYRLLLIEAIDGRRMNDPAGGDAVRDAAGLGAALAAFHALEPPDAPVFTRFAPARLSDARRLVAAHSPRCRGLGRCARARADRAATRRPRGRPSAFTATCTRRTRSSPIEASRSSTSRIWQSDPRRPTSEAFWPRWSTCGAAHVSPADTHEAVARAFLLGYASVRPLPARAALRWHTAAALLIERIFRAVTARAAAGATAHLPELRGATRAPC